VKSAMFTRTCRLIYAFQPARQLQRALQQGWAWTWSAQQGFCICATVSTLSFTMDKPERAAEHPTRNVQPGRGGGDRSSSSQAELAIPSLKLVQKPASARASTNSTKRSLGHLAPESYMIGGVLQNQSPALGFFPRLTPLPHWPACSPQPRF
jgi:hypothetical protein